MRYSVAFKFLAFLLAALALMGAFICVLGVFQAESFSFYTRDYKDWVQQRLDWQAYDLARGLAERYACTHLSNCSTDELRQLGYRRVVQDVLSWSGFGMDQFGFRIENRNGEMLDGLDLQGEDVLVFEKTIIVEFPAKVTHEGAFDSSFGAFGPMYNRAELKNLDGYEMPVTVRYYDSPDYTVYVMLKQDAALSRYGSATPLVELLYNQRYHMMWLLGICLLIFAACMVFLCCAAGKTEPHGQSRLSGLNRLPLDLYGVLAAALGALCAAVAVPKVQSWLQSGENFNSGNLMIVVLMLSLISLLILAVVYALVAQIKVKQNYWWQHTLLNRLMLGLGAVTSRLPVIWNYLMVGLCMGGAVAVGVWMVGKRLWWPLMAAAVFYLVVLCYGAYAYAALLKGAQRMAKGDLENKINTRYLTGSYARCAQSLNQLSDVAVIAAREQMRSERMRTELITNVSHDIKTPLTSIINYVDLLSKASTGEERTQYLEVLGRQSQRMKKLIEDLMELSKASSGTLPVDITRLDLTETLNQALGEFSDKLAMADLPLVYNPPAEPVMVQADGRLVWRVMSNLLSNAVKYAMPGTRVYLQVEQTTSYAEVSLKNISAEPLDISPEELTERFVRGDASRNTEGSGLGLNIAKSLMELQKGSLQLTVDGDLFKATLRFCKEQTEETAQ